MEGPGRIQTTYFIMGDYFERFINDELKSGKRNRINRGIVLHHMIERAAKADGWFTDGHPLRRGECFISRKEVARDCNITENQARAAIEWLENNLHITRTENKEAPASVGTFYLVTGIIAPAYYEGELKTTKAKSGKKADNTGIIEDSGEEKPPSTQQKPPSADGEKSACLSTFFDAGGTENNQNNIIGFPVGNSNISVDKSYTGPKTQSRANFEQFKTPQLLENYILSATRPSKERNKYICPFCGSGTKKNGTGALSIDKRRGGTSWKCFACGLSGDIFDFAGYLHNTDNKDEQLQIVAQFVNGKPLHYGKEEAPRQGIGS